MDNIARLTALGQWLDKARDEIGKQVLVREAKAATGPKTAVTIDHRLTCELDLHKGWRISTKPTFLPRAHFSSQARHYLKTADASRGRTIYCHDLTAGEVVAALSYHVDDDADIPVLITAIGLRTDAGTNAFLTYRSIAGALVLKHYVHAIAAKANRGGDVDIDLCDRTQEEKLRNLGFKNAPKIKGFRPGGVHLRQPASVN